METFSPTAWDLVFILFSAFTCISHLSFLVAILINRSNWQSLNLFPDWAVLGLGTVFALSSLIWTACYTDAEDYSTMPTTYDEQISIPDETHSKSSSDAGEVHYVAWLLVCINAFLTLESDLICLLVQWSKLLWWITMGARNGNFLMDFLCVATLMVSMLGVSIFYGLMAQFILALLGGVLRIGNAAQFESLKRSFRPAWLLDMIEKEKSGAATLRNARGGNDMALGL